MTTIKLKYVKIWTLHDSCAQIQSAIETKTITGITEKDRRGHNDNSGNKIPDQIKEDIQNHINSFPRVESHYCRASTNREYLDEKSTLTKCTIFYCDQCNTNNVVPAKLSTYINIFIHSLIYILTNQRKESCDLHVHVCAHFVNANETENKLLVT